MFVGTFRDSEGRCRRRKFIIGTSVRRPETMPGTVVVGTQFGDEGKGKIVDVLAETCDLVVRFNGGANAGHTVQVGGEQFAFRLLPSGIIRAGVLNVIGNGVVVDPAQLLEEIDALRARGYLVETLRL